MSAQMHLIYMMFHTPITHNAISWADPKDRQLEGMTSFAYWQDIARTLERGCFDGLFFADTPAASDQYKDSPETPIRYGVVWPTHDPMPLVAVMASVTSRLGFGVTLSTNGTPPYLAVRRISTLDCLSRGRIGWNVVTGHMRAEHRALGHDLVEHDERYDMADEYMDVCYKLWDSIAPDAIVADKKNGILADTSKVRIVDHQGKYFRCRAVSPTMPSLQGRPVIFQAGSSGRGMQFAVKHAEAVFAINATMSGMKKLTGEFRAAAKAAGRKDDVRVMFGCQVVIGGTEEEAKRRVEELRARVPLDAGLSRLSAPLGMDMSQFDPDQPLPEFATQASQGMKSAILALAGEEKLTLRQLAQRAGMGGSLPQVVGSPEQVADRLEAIWRESGGYGFNISPTTNPNSVHEFVDHVVPILQKRGIFRTDYPGQTFRDTLTR